MDSVIESRGWVRRIKQEERSALDAMQNKAESRSMNPEIAQLIYNTTSNYYNTTATTTAEPSRVPTAASRGSKQSLARELQEEAAKRREAEAEVERLKALLK